MTMRVGSIAWTDPEQYLVHWQKPIELLMRSHTGVYGAADCARVPLSLYERGRHP